MEKVEDQKVIDALKTVFDPEIPVDLYELGLIYKCEVTPDNDVIIQMTLTTPNCPVADEMPLLRTLPSLENHLLPLRHKVNLPHLKLSGLHLNLRQDL